MSIWQRYVIDVVGDDTQQQAADRISAKVGIADAVNQTTIGRWRSGAKQPIEAAKVAAFAQGYGRNVLEAFVAAGMLTEADAGSGLPESSRAYLETLRRPRGEIASGSGSSMRARAHD